MNLDTPLSLCYNEKKQKEVTTMFDRINRSYEPVMQPAVPAMPWQSVRLTLLYPSLRNTVGF